MKWLPLPFALLLVSVAHAATCDCSECRKAEAAAVTRPVVKRTVLTEAQTENFSVYSYDSTWLATDVGKLAEQRRAAIYEHWRGQDAAPSWNPKCVLVLHSSRQSYLAVVGRGGERTLGSSLLDVQRGTCRARRIDLLADKNNQITALAHELTHVVISDIFRGRRLPQWLDEGIAILADSHEKQLRHAEDWKEAKAAGTTFTAVGLANLEGYPAPSQFPAFYGGSASLTAFLARRGDSTKLLKFAELSLAGGYDKALRDAYQIEGLAELERLWRQSEAMDVYSVAQAVER